MQPELLSSLSFDFSKLLKDPHNYDVIFKVNGKEFKAHSIVLYTRSNYFKMLLSRARGGGRIINAINVIVNENNIVCIEMTEIDPDAFELVIIYIYTGIIDFSKVPSKTIFSFLITTSKLYLTEATSYAQSYFVDNEKAWINENFSTVLNTIFKLEDCKKIQNYCMTHVCFEAKSFFSSRDSLNLNKNILYLILDLDNLYIEEINLWDYLIGWGITQIREIHDNFNHRLNNKNNKEQQNNISLSKRDLIQLGEALKTILNPLIYRIRFREINSDDFYEKIRPYKLIIPPDIYEDTMSFYLIGSPTKIGMPSIPRRGYINSLIISSKHTSIISDWIDKKDLESNEFILKTNLYEFTLLFRGSEDGFNAINFHKYCDDSGPCVAIIKIKNSNKIIGGYNPVGWCKNNFWIHSNNSFIFSFENNFDPSKRKISRILKNHEKFSIHNCNDFNLLLNFGDGDLILDGVNGICDKSNYEFCLLNDDERCFEVEDLEIFSVIKNFKF